ncbi:hypothetical protein ACIGCK_07845 [Microbacterium sp. NPDC078428]
MEIRVEQRIERLTRVSRHNVGVLDLIDVNALEERLVADASE